MKSFFSLIFSFLFLFFSFSAFAQQYRVVGYLPYYQFGRADDVDFEKLTHLCLAFANPIDNSGTLSIGGRDIDPIVEAAHEADVKVLLSLAGGALDSEWWAAWQHLTLPENRADFISTIIDYLYEHDLQGIDMDLEWQFVKDWYSPFSIQLKDSLAAHDMLYTVALPGTYRYPEITEEALDGFDFVNMMVYDLTGPWNPDNAGPHSPYSFAENSIKYWRDRQGVSPNRLTLGVPFYGWNFDDPDNVFSFTYRSMVNKNPVYALQDKVGEAYYNGMRTIREKTELAMAEVSGVMIWELGQDSFDEFSLLNVIDETINRGVSDIDEPLAANEFRVYPNPFSDYFNFENQEDAPVQISLTDANGKLILEEVVPSFSVREIKNHQMRNGFYFLRIISEQKVVTSKVVVKQ